MRLSENWPGTVYALADETGLVWYVGQTRYTLNNRLSRHMTEARRAKKSHPLCDWVRLRLETKLPINILLVERDAVWDVAETKWIAYYRTLNPGLLNILDGGSGTPKGAKMSEETRRRMSDARKAQWADPEFRARVTASIKAERNTPKAKERLSTMQKFAWQREEVRDARISKRNETVQTEEFREKMRESATRQMSDPAARRDIGEKNRKHYEDNPSAREASAEAARKGWADPVKRAARIEAIRRSRAPKPQTSPTD